MKRYTLSICLSILAGIALAMPTQAAEELPFSAHSIVVIVEEGVIDIVEGDGEAEGLGAFTSVTAVYDKKYGKSKSTATWTFEDGSTLEMRQESDWDRSDPNVIQRTGTFKIDGGTGRFLDAKGDGTVLIIYLGEKKGRPVFECWHEGTISY